MTKKELTLLRKIKPLVEMALNEDMGSGDVTSEATVPRNLQAKGIIVAKERGIIAGLSVAGLVFRMADRGGEIRFKTKVKDGDKVKKEQVVAEVTGRARSILTAERTALNFLSSLSGIATTTAKFVNRVRPYGVKIMDTRKTAPGWRVLEKYAVATGGGENHRMGLYDGVLIKDNHLKMKSIGQAVMLARKNAPRGMRIEVEARNLREVREAVKAGADVIMLDNMKTDRMRKAVKLVRSLVGSRPFLEASGQVSLENVREIARTGVDMISVGVLTHSARALDMGLEIIKK